MTDLGKKPATIKAMERAWAVCIHLILREVQYLGDYENDDPDFRAYFEPLKQYLEQVAWPASC